MIFMPPDCRRFTFIAAVILATGLVPEYINAEPAHKAVADKGATLNFPPNMDIREFIAAVSGHVGKNFLIDPRINGKVTVLMKTPLDKNSIYDVFLDVLRTHGAVAIEQGDVIKIVPLEEAKQNTASTTKNIPRGAEQITRIVKVKNISASQLVPVLRPLMPREAYLQAYMDTNTLVISDSEKNIQRLLGVIKTMDKPGQERDQIVPLYQANAEDVLKVLRETQPKKTETSANVTADKRTNSIIISGNKAERERYLRVIKRLDTPIADQSSNHVVALKYAKAVDLAPLLDKVINKTGSGTSNASSSTSSTSATGVTGTSSSVSGNASLSGSNIVADEATNSLIISADTQGYQAVLEVLKELDIPRLQVMIEAIIAEVSMDNKKKLGVEWGVAGTNAGVSNMPETGGLLGMLLGSSSGTSTGTSTAIASVSASNVASALLTGGFSALISKGNINVMLNAIRNDTNVNILSAPQILTLDNKEAEMVVGENVPFATGSYTQPTGGAATNPFTTVQRQDVGLILKVKPQINQGGMISLEISQETSAIKDSTAPGMFTTTKRSMKSNVLVADGNMLVLGGLMDDQMNNGTDSLPLLGDIPVLGWLFKTQKTTSTKRTLMVFLKPTIVDARTNNTATQKALTTIEQEQQLFNKKDMLLTPNEKRIQTTPSAEPLLELLPQTDTAPKPVAE